METTFIYNGKTITTPNLQKKLKRMKITEADIEIISNPTPKKEEKQGLDFPLEDYHYYKYPDQQLWLLKITDNPTDTIIWNNQVLKRDIAYEENNLRFLIDEYRANRISI
jgi:hypothetical protein